MDRLRTQQEDMEAYLSGRLPYSKVKAFEKRLTQDEDLRKDFESYRKTRAHRQAIAIESYRRQIEEKKTVVSEQMEQLELAEPGAQVIPLYRRLRPYIAAAAAIALIAFFAFPFLFDIPDGGSQIPTAPIAMAEYFSKDLDGDIIPDRLLKGLDSSNVNITQLQKQALELYQKEDRPYDEIIDLVEKIPAADREIVTMYVLGQSYFQTKQYQSAVPEFRALTSDLSFGMRAEIYLLLSYLALEQQDTSAFQDLLEEILDEGKGNHDFYDVAFQIKETLNRSE